MKKYAKIILTVCLALCMILCLGLAVACQSGDNSTFTITVLNEDGTPVVGQYVQYCAEGHECLTDQTDNKGKITVDLSTSQWKDAPTMHIKFFNLPSNTNAYYNDVAYSNDDGPVIDHHKVKSATFTLKALPEGIEAGYEYDASLTTAKSYSTYLTASKAVFEADVHGGEYDLSVSVNDSATPVTATLTASNPSVELNLGTPPLGSRNSVVFKLTPKNASSNHITFTFCPVYEFGAVINVSNTDVYKVYFNVPEANAELVFTNPNPAEAILGGFPITLTIGDNEPVEWTTADDIAPISITDTGLVAFVFEFGDDAANANLYLQVDNANASSGNELPINSPIEIELASQWDDSQVFTLTFDYEEDTVYYFTFEGSDNATVTVDWLVDGDNDSVISGGSGRLLVSEDGTEGTIEITIPAGAREIKITFGTDNGESSDSYTVTVYSRSKN